MDSGLPGKVKMETYQEFLENKSQLPESDGFEPLWMPDCLFDFQAFSGGVVNPQGAVSNFP